LTHLCSNKEYQIYLNFLSWNIQISSRFCAAKNIRHIFRYLFWWNIQISYRFCAAKNIRHIFIPILVEYPNIQPNIFFQLFKNQVTDYDTLSRSYIQDKVRLQNQDIYRYLAMQISLDIEVVHRSRCHLTGMSQFKKV